MSSGSLGLRLLDAQIKEAEQGRRIWMIFIIGVSAIPPALGLLFFPRIADTITLVMLPWATMFVAIAVMNHFRLEDLKAIREAFDPEDTNAPASAPSG